MPQNDIGLLSVPIYTGSAEATGFLVIDLSATCACTKPMLQNGVVQVGIKIQHNDIRSRQPI